MRVNEAVKARILELCQQNNITLNKLSTICGITQSTLIPLSPFSPPDLDRRVDSPALCGRGSRPSGRTSG